MGTISVRVIPRSRRPGVGSGPSVTVRVRSVPEGGRATEEAGRVLAEALGVPPSSVSLRSGGRSRTKVFEVIGMSSKQIMVRLGAT